MIAKGNLHGDGGGLAYYLLHGHDNETAELVEARGLDNLGSDPVEAFVLLQKVAEANTNCEKPFFHSQTRLAPGERLTDAQWMEITDREEKRLGLVGQPRIVSFHTQENGDKHLHIGWFRIDLEMMRAIDSGLYKNHLKHLCRTLEKEYGLREVSNERQPDDKARAADRKEVEESRRLGTDNRAIRASIIDCLERTDGGKAFRAALDERGLKLANGDRRDCFVVIDQAGGQHALNKKLTGLTLAAMRDRLADLDRSQLPSVAKAKAMQQEKYPTPEREREAAQGREAVAPEPEKARPEARHPGFAPEPQRERPEGRVNPTVETIGFAWRQSPNGAAFVAALRDQDYRLARVTPEEARDSERAHAFAKEIGNFAPRYREGEVVVVNEHGAVYRLDAKTTGADRATVEKFTATIGAALPSLTEAKAAQLADREQRNAIHAELRWHNRERTKTEAKISRIMDGAEHGGASVAAGLHAEGLTLARADASGKAAMEVEYRRQYENEKLAGKADAGLRRAAFKEGELVAVNKWGDVYRLNPRFIDTEKLERAVMAGNAPTPTLSAARAYFATARQQQKDDRAAAWETIAEARQTQRDRARTGRGIRGGVAEAVGNLKDSGLKVVDAAGKVASLASFVESLFGLSAATQSRQDPPNRAEHMGGNDYEAMEDIAEQHARGQALPAEAIRHLSPAHLENLRHHGDAYMHNLIRDFEREKEQEVARSWDEYERGGRER